MLCDCVRQVGYPQGLAFFSLPPCPPLPGASSPATVTRLHTAPLHTPAVAAPTAAGLDVKAAAAAVTAAADDDDGEEEAAVGEAVCSPETLAVTASSPVETADFVVANGSSPGWTPPGTYIGDCGRIHRTPAM